MTELPSTSPQGEADITKPRLGRADVFGAVSVAGAYRVAAAAFVGGDGRPLAINADGSLSDLGPVAGLPAGDAAT